MEVKGGTLNAEEGGVQEKGEEKFVWVKFKLGEVADFVVEVGMLPEQEVDLFII